MVIAGGDKGNEWCGSGAFSVHLYLLIILFYSPL